MGTIRQAWTFGSHLPLLVLIVFVLGVQERSKAAIKVAIIVQDPKLSFISDSLTASLSKLPKFELLERAALDKILREKSLGLTQGGATLAAGRLLGADSLLFLETTHQDTNELMAVRVVATRPGEIIYATRLALPETELTEWAETFSRKLAATISKTAAPDKSTVRISLLNLRSPNDSDDSRRLDRELTELLLLRLAQEPNVIILERKQMAVLETEKEFSNSSENFWAGTYLLDGSVNEKAVDPTHVSITARIASPGLTNKFEVAGDRTNLNSVIDQLARSMLREIKISPSANWEPMKEATENLAEGQWALRWKMWKEAESGAESAWALGLQTAETAALRVRAFAGDSKSMAGIGGEVGKLKIETALEALSFTEFYLNRDPDSVTDPEWNAAYCEGLQVSRFLLEDFHASPKSRLGNDEKLAEIRADARRIIQKVIEYPNIRDEYWLPAEVPCGLPYKFEDQPHIFAVWAGGAAMFSETPEDALAIYRILISGDAFPMVRTEITQPFNPRRPLLGGWAHFDLSEDRRRWNQFAEELLKSTNIFTQLEGHLFKDRLLPNDEQRREHGEIISAFIDKNRETLINAKFPRHIRDVLIGPLTNDLDQEFRKNCDEKRSRVRSKSEFERLSEIFARNEPIDPKRLGSSYLATLAKSAVGSSYGRKEDLNLLRSLEKYLAGATSDEDKLWRTKSVLPLKLSLERFVNQSRSPLQPAPQPPPPRESAREFKMATAPIPPKLSTVRTTETLTITDYWIPSTSAFGIRRIHTFKPGIPVVSGNKLWFHAVFDPEYAGGSAKSPAALVSVSLDSLKESDVKLLTPEFFPNSDANQYNWPHGIALRKAEFFLRAQTQIAWGDQENPTRNKLPLPCKDPEIFEINGRILLADNEGIFELDTEKKRFLTLATTRKREGADVMEKLDSLQNPLLTSGPGGLLRCFADGNSYLLENGSWKKETDFDMENPVYLTGGNLLMLHGKTHPKSCEFHLLRRGEKETQLIGVPLEKTDPSNQPNSGPLKPGWIISSESLFAATPFTLGENVGYVEQNFDKTRPPYCFLVILRPGEKEIVRIPIQIKRPPSEALEFLSGPLQRSPWFIETDQYLFCGEPDEPIVFRIPRGQIDAMVKTALKRE